LAVFLVTFSGCGTVDVLLKTPTSGLRDPIPGGNQRQVIVTAPFADARRIPYRCGMRPNGYAYGSRYYHESDAVCEGDPAQWLAALLRSELRASGFTVVPAEASAPERALKVEGVLIKTFAEAVLGWALTTVETDLSVKLMATSRTGLQAERTFFVKGKSSSPTSWSPVFNSSLEDAVRQLLGEMVQAIIELMNQYPELGFRHHPTFIALWADRRQ
jgi:hypothetical protein